MLRRKPGATATLDSVDRQLLKGVDAGLPWRSLLTCASCEPAEAELRLLRLLREGQLEGTLGEAPRPYAAPVAATSSAPPGALAARDALLRELTRRSGTSYPPVSSAPPGASVPPARPSGTSYSPVSSTRPGASAPPARPSAVPSVSQRPGYYSMKPSDGEATCATRSGTPGSLRPTFDSPLAGLIDEFARGNAAQVWAAARLRQALEEELAGNVQEAIGILQLVMVQVSDPRLRVERDRLKAGRFRASSGVYRAQARDAERSMKHAQAAENWSKVLEACPDDAEAALHAAHCCIEIGELRQAGIYARRAVELAPQSVTAHKVLLRFYRKTGMEQSANREREILRKLDKK
jgi:hypothetical protein